jgi:hypothetical protein
MRHTNHPPYTDIKPGVYYFSKTVPADPREHYSKQPIAFSLKTKSLTQATRASKFMLAKLESYWNSLRLQLIDGLAGNITRRSLMIFTEHH